MLRTSADGGFAKPSLPSLLGRERRYVKLRVSSKGMRIVDKKESMLFLESSAGQKCRYWGRMRDLIKLNLVRVLDTITRR